MKDIIEKISSYNLFNNLLPGAIFVVILREVGSYDLYQENNLLGLFLYYFIGLVISRFGSLVIEPIFKKTTLLNFATYDDYVYAVGKDEKIELFSEINNMYRTIIAMLSLLLISLAYEAIEAKFRINETVSFILLIITGLMIFIFSYRKQTKYIAQRVNAKSQNV